MSSVCVSDGATGSSRERTEFNRSGKKTDPNRPESQKDPQT